jgi:cobalamin biosynthesis Mg chelatase CobN
LRSRWAILAAALLLSFIIAAPVMASAPHHVLAQSAQSGSDTSGEGSKSGTGQSDTKAETGSSKKASAPAEPEAGPPWTYQMARIIIVLSIFLGLAIFRWYWKLVASRQKAA